jgi:hypothetical protein
MFVVVPSVLRLPKFGWGECRHTSAAALLTMLQTTEEKAATEDLEKKRTSAVMDWARQAITPLVSADVAAQKPVLQFEDVLTSCTAQTAWKERSDAAEIAAEIRAARENESGKGRKKKGKSGNAGHVSDEATPGDGECEYDDCTETAGPNDSELPPLPKKYAKKFLFRRSAADPIGQCANCCAGLEAKNTLVMPGSKLYLVCRPCKDGFGTEIKEAVRDCKAAGEELSEAMLPLKVGFGADGDTEVCDNDAGGTDADEESEVADGNVDESNAAATSSYRCGHDV